MGPRLMGVLLALALPLGAMRMPAHVPSVAEGDGECAPLVIFYADVSRCYLPAHLATAEARLPARPVDPVATVGATLGLPLTQAVVLSGTPKGGPGPAIAVVYVFGRPTYARITCDARHRCPHVSRYAVVQETVGRIPGRGIAVDENPDVAPPLNVSANIPGRDLSLRVASNAGRQPTVAIARRVLDVAIHPLDDVPAAPGIRYDMPATAPAITQEQALALAGRHVGQKASAVFARYVLFSDLQHDKLPAWIVTFEGLTLAGRGPGRSYNHEENVVLDARTGAVVETFTYR